MSRGKSGRSSAFSVLAESVEWERHDARPSEVRGAISGLTGACPRVSFKVGSTMVNANGRTQYRGLTCSELATWKKAVVVKGQLQADKSLLAARVAAVKEKE